MGTCTPKTSYNYRINCHSGQNVNGRESNRTQGSGTSGSSGSSGTSGNEDSQIRRYYSLRKGSQENDGVRNIQMIDSLPRDGGNIEIVEELLNDGMGIKRTYNGQTKSILGQFQNIRETIS